MSNGDQRPCPILQGHPEGEEQDALFTVEGPDEDGCVWLHAEHTTINLGRKWPVAETFYDWLIDSGSLPKPHDDDDVKLISSPIIERIFRFIEIVGITALLSTVLKGTYPYLAKATNVAGSIAALWFVFEPFGAWITLKTHRRFSLSDRGSMLFLASMLVATVLAVALLAPAVAELSRLISKTIDR